MTRERCRGRVFAECSGNAKIKQSGSTVGIDEDVRRFEVPMDNPLGVRVLNSFAYRAEQPDPFGVSGGFGPSGS